MKVENKQHEEGMRRLQKLQRRQIDRQNKQIQLLKEEQKKVIKEEKRSGNAKLSRTREGYAKRLQNISKEYEEKLKNLQKTVTATQDHLNKEKGLIAQRYEDKLLHLGNNFNRDYTEMSFKNRQALQDQDRVVNESLLKIHEDNTTKVGNLEARYKSGQKRDYLKHKGEMMEQQTRYDELKLVSESKFKGELSKQDFDQVQAIEHDKRQFRKKMETLKKQQKYQYDLQVKRFKDSVKQADKDFKTKYDNITKMHAALLDKLNIRARQDIQEAKESNLASANKFFVKDKNPVYKSPILNYVVKESEKNYEIQLEVPEYEQDLVQFSGKGRNVQLSATRNVSNNYINDKTKDSQKYAKAESIKRSFSLKHSVDHNKVTKSYKDKILTFTVPKV